MWTCHDVGDEREEREVVYRTATVRRSGNGGEGGVGNGDGVGNGGADDHDHAGVLMPIATMMRVVLTLMTVIIIMIMLILTMNIRRLSLVQKTMYYGQCVVKARYSAHINLHAAKEAKRSDGEMRCSWLEACCSRLEADVL